MGRDHTEEECGDKIMQNFVKYAKNPKKSLWISNKDETQICVGKRPLHGLEENGDGAPVRAFCSDPGHR